MSEDKLEPNHIYGNWPRVTQGTTSQDIEAAGSTLTGDFDHDDQTDELLDMWPRITFGSVYHHDEAAESKLEDFRRFFDSTANWPRITLGTVDIELEEEARTGDLLEDLLDLWPRVTQATGWIAK